MPLEKVKRTVREMTRKDDATQDTSRDISDVRKKKKQNRYADCNFHENSDYRASFCGVSGDDRHFASCRRDHRLASTLLICGRVNGRERSPIPVSQTEFKLEQSNLRKDAQRETWLPRYRRIT